MSDQNKSSGKTKSKSWFSFFKKPTETSKASSTSTATDKNKNAASKPSRPTPLNKNEHSKPIPSTEVRRQEPARPHVRRDGTVRTRTEHKPRVTSVTASPASLVQPTLDSGQKFSDLDLIEPLQRAVSDLKYVHPTPIQQQAIPHLLAGRDLLGNAQTGTGKTAAFALPMLQRLHESGRRPESKRFRALVLTPTRELAVQINQSFVDYGKHLRMRSAVIFGGVSQVPQVSALKGGLDILVATPGRFLDLMEQRHLDLKGLEIFVLDEADRMLDMGFIHDIKKIIKALPTERQNLFFSATMAPEIDKLASSFLRNPERVAVNPVSSTAEMIDQKVIFVEKAHKRELLRHILQNPEMSKVIVFTRTKHGANQVSEMLGKNGFISAAIHGNKSQTARQKALESFRAGKVQVLVATDIAARGIDIDEITHVINFELPNVPEDYVHRIGRTARAGAKGEAISFCNSEERTDLRAIERLTGRPLEVITLEGFKPSAVVAGSASDSDRPRGPRGQGRSGGSRRGGGSRSGSAGGRRGNSRSR